LNLEATAEWALGQRGQDALEAWLSARRIGFVRYYRIEGGGAPSVQGMNPIVLPDLGVVHKGRTCAVESKAKAVPWFWRNRGILVHCIDQRLWREYKAFERESGTALLLAFWERNDAADVDRLYELHGPFPPTHPFAAGTMLCGWLDELYFEPWSTNTGVSDSRVSTDRSSLKPLGEVLGVGELAPRQFGLGLEP